MGKHSPDRLTFSGQITVAMVGASAAAIARERLAVARRLLAIEIERLGVVEADLARVRSGDH